MTDTSRLPTRPRSPPGARRRGQDPARRRPATCACAASTATASWSGPGTARPSVDEVRIDAAPGRRPHPRCRARRPPRTRCTSPRAAVAGPRHRHAQDRRRLAPDAVRRRRGDRHRPAPAAGPPRRATCGSPRRPARSSWSRCPATWSSRRRAPSRSGPGRCPATCGSGRRASTTSTPAATSGDIRIEARPRRRRRATWSAPCPATWSVVTPSPVRIETQTIAGDVRATGPHTAEGGRGRRTLVVGDGSVALSRPDHVGRRPPARCWAASRRRRPPVPAGAGAAAPAAPLPRRRRSPRYAPVAPRSRRSHPSPPVAEPEARRTVSAAGRARAADAPHRRAGDRHR